MSRSGPGRVVAVAAATLLGAATAYLAPAVIGTARDTYGVSPTGSTPPLPTAAGSTRPEPAAVSPVPTQRPPTPVAPATPPVRVSVTRLGIAMAVRPEGVDATGQMALPEDPRVAGWYRFGPAPAENAGAVVLAAHVDSRIHGIGPFARLSALRAGDQIVVDDGSASWLYLVERIDRVAKEAADLPGMFSRDGAPRLHLITCTGRYDRASGYTANLVVVAGRSSKVP